MKGTFLVLNKKSLYTKLFAFAIVLSFIAPNVLVATVARAEDSDVPSTDTTQSTSVDTDSAPGQSGQIDPDSLGIESVPNIDHNQEHPGTRFCANGTELSRDEFIQNVKLGLITMDLTPVMANASDSPITTATFTVTNTTGCTAPISLASYRDVAPLIPQSAQVLFDRVQGVSNGDGSTLTLTVNLPDCMSQVEAWYGLAPTVMNDMPEDAFPNSKTLMYEYSQPGNYCEKEVPPPSCENGQELTFDEFKQAVTDGTIGYTLTPVMATSTDPLITTATFTIHNNTGCTAPVSLASYKDFHPIVPQSNQQLFDRVGIIEATTSASLTVNLPTCMAQVQAVYGEAATVLPNSIFPNSKTLMYEYHLPGKFCVKPTKGDIDNGNGNTTDTGNTGTTNGGGSSHSSGGGGSAAVGEVLGAETAPTDSCEYIHDFMKKGWDNSPAEVRMLQYFLKNFGGSRDLSITSVFDDATFSAVSKYQSENFDKILKPWGYDHSTGFVYILTQKTINETLCNGRLFPLTVSQEQEVNAR